MEANKIFKSESIVKGVGTGIKARYIGNRQDRVKQS